MVAEQADTLAPHRTQPAHTEDPRAAPATLPRDADSIERILAEVLADVVQAADVAADSDFFADLGADSLVMAKFCARIRKRADMPPVSMKDVYRHPTVGALAASLATTVSEAPLPAAAPAPTTAPSPPAVREPGGGSAHYVLCGLLQLLSFLGYSLVVAFVATQGYDWVSGASGALDAYLRAVVFGVAAFLCLSALPILAKWTLIGRWKPLHIRVWSLGYVRFWLVKSLVRADPLVLFAGSPLYTGYLRLLGARIGRGVTVFSRSVPVCTDLLTIGAGSVVRKDASFSCYRAHDGVIQTGPVTLGKDTTVSAATVLDIGTSLGDGARLGHASSLHRGQSVPAGEHWHGSPAQRADADVPRVDPVPFGPLRRPLHSLLQLLTALLLYIPLAVGGVGILLAQAPQLAAFARPGPTALTTWVFYTEAFAASVVLFFGAIPLGLLLVTLVPRLLGRTLTPGRAYPLFGFHHGVQRTIELVTNRKFLNRLFGDSSAIVHYLRHLGYDLSHVHQTGSNFGTEVKHEVPTLSTVGSGTMVADGLSIINTDYSSTSFRVSRTSIGPRNFLGNRIAYPPQGRTGDNCLLATKVMVPVDGPVREGVGLLGSPSFEIPRSVLRDSSFDRLKAADELRRLLPRKNRHNAATMGWYLLVRWLHFFLITLLVAVAAELHGPYGVFAIALVNVLVLAFSAGYFVLVERAFTARTPLVPLFCSIYDIRFWRHERYWKAPSESYLRIFNGTPFKNVIWRLLGVRIGRRVFDDGCFLTERAMAAIGDHCTLNNGAVVQCHSQEDGTFKSDRTAIGARCTLGVGAFVHYGVTIGDGAELAPDSFLMKGEVVPENARWGGNPARPMEPSDTPGGGGPHANA
ncbi:Pls/PosA family non-ribosomal peptide synthetase [Streptomyces rubiginosohelvolus]|uniref:Pls/PosA family non-ribosomal peptide synthetase n=1 Tax=Streptomyces TaxID=1883 RepID=UPI000BEFE709|nr:Pls/PosA family non-ribosomal peptide synthetase [Streptomyces sp. gb14]